MTRTISESQQCRPCSSMSSEQLNLCNVYFFVHALPKGRCLTEHCVVCLLCCGLCVSLGGRSGLCNYNMCTYILLRIYRYIHIYVWQGKLCCFYCSLQIILGIGSVFTISCSFIWQYVSHIQISGVRKPLLSLSHLHTCLAGHLCYVPGQLLWLLICCGDA